MLGRELPAATPAAAADRGHAPHPGRRSRSAARTRSRTPCRRISRPRAGARVLVPLGKRVLTGVVLSGCGMRDAGSGSAIAGCGCGIRDPFPDLIHRGTGGSRTRIAGSRAIKPIADILDDDGVPAGRRRELATWVADYYACGPGRRLRRRCRRARGSRASATRRSLTRDTCAIAGGTRPAARRSGCARSSDKPVRVEALVGSRRSPRRARWARARRPRPLTQAAQRHAHRRTGPCASRRSPRRDSMRSPLPVASEARRAAAGGARSAERRRRTASDTADLDARGIGAGDADAALADSAW